MYLEATILLDSILDGLHQDITEFVVPSISPLKKAKAAKGLEIGRHCEVFKKN